METAGFNAQLSANGTAGFVNHILLEAGHACRCDGAAPVLFFILLALSTLAVTVR